jgi:hypothetical protein
MSKTYNKSELDINNLPELKVCPWCGYPPIIRMDGGLNWDIKKGLVYNRGGGYGLWVVCCQLEDPDCEMRPKTASYALLDDAIKAWNKRKPSILEKK